MGADPWKIPKWMKPLLSTWLSVAGFKLTAKDLVAVMNNHKCQLDASTQWFIRGKVQLLEHLYSDERLKLPERFKQKSRSNRLADAVSEIQSGLQQVEDLKDEMEQWYDNMPENLQNSDKAQEVESCKDELEQAASTIQEAVDTLENITFPGMY